MKTLVALLLLLATAAAAPAPWGIAINNATEECAGYWAGDEFYGYVLPDGWGAYYPDYANSVIATPYGNCTWTYDNEEGCCDELGLTYVSDNIGKGFDTGLFDDCNYWGNCSEENETCSQEGEFVNPSPGFNLDYPDECCEGLTPTGAYDPETCEQLLGTPYAKCIACGDGVCENSTTENRCNCPEDCEETTKKVDTHDSSGITIAMASLLLILFGLILIKKAKK